MKSEKLSERLTYLIEHAEYLTENDVADAVALEVENATQTQIIDDCNKTIDGLKIGFMQHEDENQKLKEEIEKLRWYDLGCQGKMDLLPLIEKAQRAESAEAENKTLDDEAVKLHNIIVDQRHRLTEAESQRNCCEELFEASCQDNDELRDRLTEAKKILSDEPFYSTLESASINRYNIIQNAFKALRGEVLKITLSGAKDSEGRVR